MPNYVPDGYQPLIPVLICTPCAKAIDYYVAAFGAVERLRMPMPDGRVGHAELEFDGCCVMMADEFPEMEAWAPPHYGGSPQSLMLYVRDVDAVVARAVELGATLVYPVQDKFYGDRTGTVRCPFGHKWSFATHIEDVPPEELAERAKKAHG